MRLFLLGLAVGWLIPAGILVAAVCWFKYGDRKGVRSPERSGWFDQP